MGKVLKINKVNFQHIIRSYLPLLILGATVVIIFEASHHGAEDQPFYLDSSFWTEFLIYGIFLPVVGARVMLFAHESVNKLNRSERLLHLHKELNQRLANTQDWEKLIETIVEYPIKILPLIQTTLHIYDPDQRVFNFVKAWNASGVGLLPVLPVIKIQDCPEDLFMSSKINLRPCSLLAESDYSSNFPCYAMPLFHKNELIALINIALPPNINQDDLHLEDMTVGAHEIALALSNALMERRHTSKEQVLDEYRHSIAKDIHDTLGQNIAYLRLKLDKLVESGDLQDIKDVHSELEQMRVVADVAYTNMRGALDALQPVRMAPQTPANDQQLSDSLLEQAQAIGKRGNLNVHLVVEGEPQMVSPKLQRQILLIASEAMHNVEKHAGAENINLHLSWEDKQLKLNIIDDGCGFCTINGPTESLRNGHYGLSIMRERALAVNGELSISSQAGQGTSVTLEMPLYNGNSHATGN